MAGAKLFHLAENNGDSEFDSNGEQWLLFALTEQWRRAPQFRTRVIMDIGANLGDYTSAVLGAAGRNEVTVQIYAFEPGAQTRNALAERFANETRVKIEGSAVGEHAGKHRLHSDKPLSKHASLFKRGSIMLEQGEIIDVIRLEDFMKERKIGVVDFIKLDIEGAELAALKGLGEMLYPDRVSAIQFEYGGSTLDAGVRLRDLFAILEERGYIVAKLMPRALLIRKYSEWMDHFWYANYVALDPRAMGQRS